MARPVAAGRSFGRAAAAGHLGQGWAHALPPSMPLAFLRSTTLALTLTSWQNSMQNKIPENVKAK